MIGCAPYFMRPLARALLAVNLRPLYAFSIRESVERIRADGSIEKVNVFRHVGFVGNEFAEYSAYSATSVLSETSLLNIPPNTEEPGQRRAKSQCARKILLNPNW